MEPPRFTLRRPSYALVVSVLAVLVATAGTATAARTKAKVIKKNSVTTRTVKNNSLTGADFRNGSLAPFEFTRAAQRYMRTSLKQTSVGTTGPRGIAGNRGPQGPDGDNGAKGATGNAGPKGQQGDAAMRQFSFNYRDASGRFNSMNGANSPAPIPWYMRSSSVVRTNQAEFLDSTGRTVADLNQATNTGGTLTLTRHSDVLVQASVTLAHRGDFKCLVKSTNEVLDAFSAEDPGSLVDSCGTSLDRALSTSEADDENVHTRAECWLEKANYPDGTGVEPLGVRSYVSASSSFRLVNQALVGGITLAPGTYSFRTKCRAADRTGNAAHDDWEFVSGNMTVLAAADSLGG